MDRRKELDFSNTSSILSEDEKYVFRWIEFYNAYDQLVLLPKEYHNFFNESYPTVTDTLEQIWEREYYCPFE
jgi:hypothetical protein